MGMLDIHYHDRYHSNYGLKFHLFACGGHPANYIAVHCIQGNLPWFMLGKEFPINAHPRGHRRRRREVVCTCCRGSAKGQNIVAVLRLVGLGLWFPILGF